MPEAFRDLLLRRMRELGLNYEDLARQVKVSSVYISKIIKGKVVPGDDIIFGLAQALGLDLSRLVLLAHYEKAGPREVKEIFERLTRHSPAEFLGEVKDWDNIELTELGTGRPVPVVGLVPAGGFMPAEDGGFPAGAADALVYSDQKGRNLFGVRVVNDSMEPDFKEGDVLIVNPNLKPQSGDFVIAKLKDDNEATFKKLVIHEQKPGQPLLILRPLNQRYDDILVTDPARLEIVGKVVERKTLF